MTDILIISALAASLLPCCNINTARPEILGPVDRAIAASVAEASDRFCIPRNWIEAVIMVESGGSANAISPKGAMGVMQIMPSTWSSLRFRYHLGGNPFDIHDNIIAGTGLLHELYARFGTSGFLAAYNAGSSRYIASLTAGRPLNAETRDYLTKLVPFLGGEMSRAVLAPISVQDWRKAPLFAVAWSGVNQSAPIGPPSKTPAGKKMKHAKFITDTGEIYPLRPIGAGP